MKILTVCLACLLLAGVLGGCMSSQLAQPAPPPANASPAAPPAAPTASPSPLPAVSADADAPPPSPSPVQGVQEEISQNAALLLDEYDVSISIPVDWEENIRLEEIDPGDALLLSQYEIRFAPDGTEDSEALLGMIMVLRSQDWQAFYDGFNLELVSIGAVDEYTFAYCPIDDSGLFADEAESAHYRQISQNGASAKLNLIATKNGHA